MYDVLIIGGGPGGYTAALYCARAGLSTLLMEKLATGGQLAQTGQVDNYPGFPDGIDGFTLAQRMRQGAERFGAHTRMAEVTDARLSGSVKILSTSEGDVQGRAVIIATGAAPRLLGLENERALTGRGVSYCAACDGMLYKGRDVAVVGGGNTAAEDALTLSRVAKSVAVIHRRDTLRASKIYHAPLMAAPNVRFFWNSAVEELLGSERLTGLRLKSTQTSESFSLPTDGLFVAIGRVPETAFLRGSLPLAPDGAILADETTRTALPGVFAVGDVRAKAMRQIVTAAADGAVACHYAESYLASLAQQEKSALA